MKDFFKSFLSQAEAYKFFQMEMNIKVNFGKENLMEKENIVGIKAKFMKVNFLKDLENAMEL